MYIDKTGRRNSEGYPDPTAARAARRVACSTCGRWRAAPDRSAGVCRARVSAALGREGGPLDSDDLCGIAAHAVTAPDGSCGGWVPSERRRGNG